MSVTWLDGGSGNLFLLPRETMSCSLFPIFGVLLMIRLFDVTTQPSFASPRRSPNPSNAVSFCTTLTLRKLQWEVLFMMMMVKVMIIDSHYYNHHYYLVLINSWMKGALKNTK